MYVSIDHLSCIKNMDIKLGTTGLEPPTRYMNELPRGQRTIALLALSY